MDFKNKYLVMSARIIIAFLFLFAAVAGFMGAKAAVEGKPMEGMSQKDIAATKVLWESGILQLVKFLELVIAIMLIFNFLPALAAIFMATLSIGFIVYNAMMGSTFGLIMSVIIAVINIYFGYVYFDKYRQLFDCEKKK